MTTPNVSPVSEASDSDPLSHQSASRPHHPHDISLFKNVGNVTINGGSFSLYPTNYMIGQSHVESNQHVKNRKLCPLPVASSTGRRDIMEKMHKYFESDSEFQRVFVLYGLGGSGKSQLAFKFLQESRANKLFSDIFYIDATNKQTLEMDLEAISPGSVKQSVDESLRWLANQHEGRWLLLFDNADDVQLKLNKFFPPLESRCDKHGSRRGNQPALAFVQAEETEENKQLAAQIVQELHHFALAISQAGAFIHCHSSLRHYRGLYQRERDNLLQNVKVQGSDPYGLAVYGLAVYGTWKLSYDKLDTSARSLLQICSMLHHEGISEEMFEKAAISVCELEDSKLQKEVTHLLNHLGRHKSGWSPWDFQQVINCLGAHSLIEYDRCNCTYGLHPLVQKWSGTTIDENRDVMRKCVVSIIGMSISWTFSEEDYRYRRTLLKHINKATALLDRTVLDPSIASRLALAYSEQGYWTQAKGPEVIEKRKRLLGDDRLASMESLTNIYQSQSRWDDAEKLGVVVMEKRKQLLGDDHPQTLASMENLATTYQRQGRWNDAEKLGVVVMESRKWLLGDDHPQTLASMENLASIYQHQGRWNDAEKLGVVVMESGKWLLGDDNPQTLASMENIASIYQHQGRWNDAEKLGVMVMKKKRMLGPSNLYLLPASMF